MRSAQQMYEQELLHHAEDVKKLNAEEQEERESEDPLLDLVMSDILGLGEEPVQSLEEVLRETEYLDTSGLNDYDSLSSLPGGGPQPRRRTLCGARRAQRSHVPHFVDQPYVALVAKFV